MRRREFITLLTGTALAGCPITTRARQAGKPVIGWLCSESSDVWAARLDAFHEGLNKTGYTQGSNVAFEYRWAEGHYDRLAEMAAELVRRNVDVIAVGGGNVAALAAKSTNTTIPNPIRYRRRPRCPWTCE